MPVWRLFARDGEGRLDLHEIIEGELLDAEAACARSALRTGRPVNAELITNEPEQEPPDGSREL